MSVKIPKIEHLKKESFAELLDPDFQKRLVSRRPIYRFLKRLIDIIFSIVALLFFAPVWIIIIILIRLDSRGQAIFRHERIGKDGKTFTLHKFRTMFEGVKTQEFAPLSLDDKRITRVGKFLRKTSLDEVPQFWNVLMGQMSLVGPRPEMGFIVKKYSNVQRSRLLVKPGITGLWQIHGRKDLPLHENAEYDFFYIKHQSLLLDLIILLKTISVVISGKGAY